MYPLLFGNLQNLGQSIARGLGNIPLAFWLLANKEIKLTLPLASGWATLRFATHKIHTRLSGNTKVDQKLHFACFWLNLLLLLNVQLHFFESEFKKVIIF